MMKTGESIVISVLKYPIVIIEVYEANEMESCQDILRQHCIIWWMELGILLDNAIKDKLENVQ